MDRVADYLRRAEEAEARAQQGLGLFRDQMLQVARQWRDLARQAGDLAANQIARADKDA